MSRPLAWQQCFQSSKNSPVCRLLLDPMEIFQLFLYIWILQVLFSHSIAEDIVEGEINVGDVDVEPFLWGTATAAYQIEGAANVDGR
jgi:hypothetical protein